MELDLLCIQTDCQQPWCSESNMNNRNATSTEIQGTILAIEWSQSLHPAIVTNQSYIKFQLRKPMKPKNITIIVWSINTMSMACLPLCFLTSHVSVIRIAIFQVPFLVCNSDMRFSFQDMATIKWQCCCYKYIKLIYKTEQYSMQTIIKNVGKQN